MIGLSVLPILIAGLFSISFSSIIIYVYVAYGMCYCNTKEGVHPLSKEAIFTKTLITFSIVLCRGSSKFL